MSATVSAARPFTLPGRLVFAAALAAGTALAPRDPRLALVAAAVVFGWTQIGGL